MMEKKLFTVNCHMYTEASDFLGGLRPVRRRSDGEDEVSVLCPSVCKCAITGCSPNANIEAGRHEGTLYLTPDTVLYIKYTTFYLIILPVVFD